ncbi:MAG: T9SS type A sorting domain-containing protein [Bacteroidetes bacterium]|nr:T9SS type A sorting domain-containing protein [Bacteroidota bacterium]
MKTPNYYSLSIILLLAATPYHSGLGQSILSKTASLSPSYSSLNINNLQVFFQNNGSMVDSLGKHGVEFPRNAGTYLSFENSFAISGYIEDELRTAWLIPSRRIVEWRPGNLTEAGPAPSSNRFRIYKINRGDDWRTSEDIQKWPADLGAPWIDRNGDGIYQPEQGDYPDLTGDQMLWMVINDGVEPYQRLEGNKQINLECRIKAFAFNQPGAIENAVFVEYQLINKNPLPIRDAIFTIFADSEIGISDDDLGGCDTTRYFCYGYNQTDFDRKYGNTPPALGSGILAGPVIRTVTEDRTAWVNGHLKSGFRQARMGSHLVFIHSRGNFYPSNVDQARYFQLGLNGMGESLNPSWNGIGGTALDNPRLNYPGYPETQTGWIASNGYDITQFLSTEPFDMAPGDTQTILTTVFAARGTSNLNSIAELRKSADLLRAAVPEIYSPLPAPPAPTGIRTQITQKGAVQISFDASEAAAFTQKTLLGHSRRFKAFRLRQYRTLSGVWEETGQDFIPVKTLRLPDRQDDLIPGMTGDVLSPEDFSGLKMPGARVLWELPLDPATAHSFTDGATYEFGLSAVYLDSLGLNRFLSPDGLPLSVEESGLLAESQEIRFQVLYHGSLTQDVPDYTETGLSSLLTRVSGQSDLGFQVVVTDQSRIKTTGNQPVSFYYAGEDLKWVTAGADGVVYSPVLQPVGDAGYAFQFRAQPTRFLSEDVSGRKWWTESGNWVSGGVSPLDRNRSDSSGLWVQASPDSRIRTGSDIPDSRLRMIEVEWTKIHPSLAYRYLSGVQPVGTAFGPPAWQPAKIHKEPYYQPVIWAGFTKTGPAAPLTGRLPAQYLPGRGVVSLPLRAWAVEGDGQEERYRQLKVGLVETWSGNSNSNPDGRWDGDPDSREVILISADTYSPDLTMPADSLSLDPEMDFLVRGTQLTGSWMAAWEPAGDTLQVVEGSRVRFRFNQPTHEDRFELAGLESDSAWYEREKSAILNRITLFPNPYMGDNSQELNVGERYITLLNLPEKVTVRIYNLAGERVARLEKNDRLNYLRWDLTNGHRFYVASGIYLLHIEAPGIGEKILKAAIVQREW